VVEGLCLVVLGMHAKGEQILEEIVGGSEATPWVVARARLFLARAKADRGELDEALADATALADAARASEQQGQQGQLGSLRLQLARIQLRRRDIEAAEREALAAIDFVALRPRDRALALATLADVRLAQGRPAEALASVEQAMATLQSIPPAYRAGVYLPLVHAEALDATGDHEGARAVIARARAELFARADKIGDPVIRRSFLENVPENARLLSRARQWLGEPATAPA
jgi:ATP/maltotriose-dependent transcriptional regulator MalT